MDVAFRVKYRDLERSEKALWKRGPLGMENIWGVTGHSNQDRITLVH